MTKNFDHIKVAVAYAIIFAFLFNVVAIVFVPIPETMREIFAHMMGMIDSAFIGGLVAYYYTRSDKTTKPNGHE